LCLQLRMDTFGVSRCGQVDPCLGSVRHASLR
jgi:hypothetical protein